jgi:hypothetical protein
MAPGFYDNLKFSRRELWLEWNNNPIFYGWCHKDFLRDMWEPTVPFGTFPNPTRR